jgi:Lanthionine-containing peptide SapB precursor RamS
MTLLDMQGLSQTRWGGGGGSHLSVALCDSVASITLCL